MNETTSLKLVCVVEGHGEVQAVPALIRRVLECAAAFPQMQIPVPIRTPRDRFLRNEDEQRKVLRLAYEKAAGSPILILMDADDDCPVALSSQIRKIIDRNIDGVKTGIVVAEREYEAWFLAAATSLGGVGGLERNLLPPANCGTLRNCKRWLADRMISRTYSETIDQPRFSSRLCPSLAAQNSRSFKKFASEVERLVGLPALFGTSD
jgi:hypothetical protein